MYWHLHVDHPPWCVTYCYEEVAEKHYHDPAIVAKHGPLTLITSKVSDRRRCDYYRLMRGFTVTSPALVRLPDGTDVDGASLTCEGCGKDVADHACAGSTRTGGGAITYSRSTGPRKPASAHPACPHCGGRVHFNMGGTAVNAECITRQYALDKGLMSDPNGRLPVLTIEMMGDIVAWNASLSATLTYGKMDSSAGGAATYSGLRPKTGRKKKVEAAPAGSRIEDMAADEAPTEETTASTSKRTRKGKTTTIENPMANAEELAIIVPAPYSDEEGNVVYQAEEIAAEADEQPVSEASTEDEARRKRAEKRAARKAILAGKV